MTCLLYSGSHEGPPFFLNNLVDEPVAFADASNATSETSASPQVQEDPPTGWLCSAGALFDVRLLQIRHQTKLIDVF